MDTYIHRCKDRRLIQTPKSALPTIYILSTPSHLSIFCTHLSIYLSVHPKQLTTERAIVLFETEKAKLEKAKVTAISTEVTVQEEDARKDLSEVCMDGWMDG